MAISDVCGRKGSRTI